MMRKLVTTSCIGVLLATLSLSGTAFADTGPGASACQPAAGQLTATIAQTGTLGTIISTIAPIAELNQQSLFHCG